MGGQNVVAPIRSIILNVMIHHYKHVYNQDKSCRYNRRKGKKKSTCNKQKANTGGNNGKRFKSENFKHKITPNNKYEKIFQKTQTNVCFFGKFVLLYGWINENLFER